MNQTDQAYLKLARTSLKKCEEVQTYYRKCLRLERHKKQPFLPYIHLLAELGEIKERHLKNNQ